MREDLNPPNRQQSSQSNLTSSQSQNSVTQANAMSSAEGTFDLGVEFTGIFWGLGIFLVILITLFSSLFILRRFIHFWKKAKDWRKTVFIEVSVTKDTAEQVQKERASQQVGDREMIGAGEQLFTIMAEYAQTNFKTWFFGAPRFSLEIVNINQEIRFWIATNEEIASVLERQIIAIYPKANIVRLKKTEFFKPNTVAYAQELELNRRFELPFKTYTLMTDDPLNSITNAMSGLAESESAAIQLILTPINDSWQSMPRELATKINQGQNPEDFLFPKSNPLGWLSSIFSFFGDVFTSFTKKKDDGNPLQQDKKDRRFMDVTGRYESIQLTEQQREVVKKLEEKATKPGFVFTLRIVGSALREARAKQIVDGIIPAFQIYDIRPFNWFKKTKTNSNKALVNFLLRAPNLPRHSIFGGSYRQDIINTEEVCSLWHVPNYLVTTPNIKWLLSRRPPIPLEVPGPGKDRTYIGTAISRGQTKDCYINLEDRYRHIYSLGGSGSGKTVTMLNIMLQDIEMGHGACLIDPHGEGVDDILRRIPEHRMQDVVLFSPSITDRPLGLNMLETDPLKPTQKTLVIDTLFTIWDKLYDLKKTGGPMFENYMKNSMRLVMAHPESGNTLMEISKILTDEDFRTFKLAMCEEQEVIDFWDKEATKARGETSLENMVPYITSKLAPFITNDFIKPMIAQPKSAINWREAMDNKKIILVSLSKGLIGETSAYLVGMIIIGGLLMAGMGRSDGLRYNPDGTTSEITPDERPPFFVYIDEMQNFLFDSIPKALEEIRKYKVGFYLAHQFIKQVVVQGDERIKDSIMANCATKLIYRCGADDAKYLEAEFAPLTAQDIANPEARSYNAILLINGQRTTPFNIQATYPRYFEMVAGSKMQQAESLRKQILEMTKQRYGIPREQVEKMIKDRAKLLF